MKHVQITDPAADDLDQIWEYIARDNPAAADRWVDQLTIKLDLYSGEPLLREARPEFRVGLRQFGFGSYVVFYRPTDAGIEVIRVIHATRNIRRIDLR